MIARHWRGWTKPQNADAYEHLLREIVFAQLKKISGYHGAYILRRESQDETEFVVINFFDSIDAVKAFAGEEYGKATFEPEARKLLSRIETVANHYDVAATPSLNTGNQHAN